MDIMTWDGIRCSSQCQCGTWWCTKGSPVATFLPAVVPVWPGTHPKRAVFSLTHVEVRASREYHGGMPFGRQGFCDSWVHAVLQWARRLILLVLGLRCVLSTGTMACSAGPMPAVSEVIRVYWSWWWWRFERRWIIARKINPPINLYQSCY